jgi:PAS domain S-box-containing protein
LNSKVLIVDDHEAVRSGIRSLFAFHSEWAVCGEAADGIEAIEKAKSLRPDVILMDVSMPRMDGVEATRIIRREMPEIGVLIISQNDPGLMQEAAVHVGAKGFIQKSKLAHELFPALEKVVNADGENRLERKHGGSEPAATTSPSEPATLVAPSWLAGRGEMGELIRAKDWSQTPLGPAASWSPALRMIVNFLLANRFPQLLWWGSEFCSIYNDAYIPILGTKHPWALGRPVSEVWNEIWHVLKPLIETPFSGGPATWMEDIPLEINRKGFFEETHFTIAYSPVPDESVRGGIGGVLATVHEITEKVVGERRVRALRDLGARSVEPKSAEEACIIVRETLSPHSKDIPFLLLYLLDESQRNARLACCLGVDQADRGCPSFLDLSSPADEVWPLSNALASEDIQLVEELKNRFDKVPQGPWSDPPSRAAVLPIRSNLQHQMAGFMVAGLSARLEVDKSYRDFLELMSTQVATTVANALAYEGERKRAQALAELDRAKTAFFSNVSHEFRTPLTLMLGPLEDTLAEGKLGAEQREQLELAHRNSLRLLKLVNALLDFSRIEASRIEGSYEPTDLARFTSELASAFHAAVEHAGMRLVCDCPVLAEAVYVDREMWEKIVFNLLSNAFKHTFEGEIKVSLRQVQQAVELEVKDTGTGIAAHHLPHLFERFYRVEGARGRTNEGSGIGLALVQELVKLHGGTVQVESELGRGSTFTVAIPLGKAHLPADRIEAERTLASTETSPEAYVQEVLHWPGSEGLADEIQVETLGADTETSSHHPSAAKPRILLADDNADMREYVSRLLRGHYDVEAVADGEKALQSARERRPDLILSDVMMPKLDGFALVQSVRSDEAMKGIPVILLSARAGEESRVEGLESGADDYLIKPFSARELQARVRSQLAMARIRQEGKELEHKLRLEAELLAAIVASSDDAIISKNLDGIITSWNKSAERIFGYTAKEAVGQHITLIIPPERSPEEVQIIERLRRGERIDHFQTVRLRKDGTRVDVSSTLSPVRDSSGRVVGASKVARDITAEKHAAERERQITAAALAATAKFQAVFEQTTVFAGIMNTDGVLIEANKLCLDACGYRAEEVLGKPFWQTGWWRNHPESRDKIQAATPLAAQGICYRETLHYSWADGTERLVDFALYPILDDKGEILFVHPTGVDITDLKRAEENYRTLADNISQFAWMTDSTGWIFWYNRRWFEYTGTTLEEMKGWGWQKVHHPDHVARVVEKFKKHIDSGEVWEDTFPLRGKDGEYRWFLSRAVPIRDAKGRIIRWFGTNTDITELREAEAALRRSKEFTEEQVRRRTQELELRNREVTIQSEHLRMLSQRLLQAQDEERRRVARELHDSAGQTLTVLSMGLAQLAQKAARSAPDLATDAEMIEETVRQLHREIRTTSYLLHPPLLDEAGLTSALNWYIQGLVERSGLKISLEIPEGVGRLPRDMELAIFRLVQECLTNIHRHSGSQAASIRIARKPAQITIEVRDQGKGMLPEKLAEIQSYGSGVGIRGMRERVRQFGGNLQVESDPSGTRVFVSLPVAADASQDEKPGIEPLQAAV